jgi:hypothetical protein
VEKEGIPFHNPNKLEVTEYLRRLEPEESESDEEASLVERVLTPSNSDLTMYRIAKQPDAVPKHHDSKWRHDGAMDFLPVLASFLKKNLPRAPPSRYDRFDGSQSKYCQS